MTINGVSTILAIASLTIQRVSLHLWLIIELSPAFLGKPWLCQHQDYILNPSVNGASTTFRLASWKIQELHGDIKLSSNCWTTFDAKMDATTSLQCAKNERQRSVNDFWHCILQKARVVRRHWRIIELSADFLVKNTSDKSVTMSHNECQRFLIMHLG